MLKTQIAKAPLHSLPASSLHIEWLHSSCCNASLWAGPRKVKSRCTAAMHAPPASPKNPNLPSLLSSPLWSAPRTCTCTWANATHSQLQPTEAASASFPSTQSNHSLPLYAHPASFAELPLPFALVLLYPFQHQTLFYSFQPIQKVVTSFYTQNPLLFPFQFDCRTSSNPQSLIPQRVCTCHRPGFL